MYYAELKHILYKYIQSEQCLYIIKSLCSLFHLCSWYNVMLFTTSISTSNTFITDILSRKNTGIIQEHENVSNWLKSVLLLYKFLC